MFWRLPICCRWAEGGEKFRAEIAEISDEQRSEARARAIRQLNRADELGVRIVSFDSPFYPVNVLDSNNPIPILWILGDAESLRVRNAVACVGSRKIRQPYSDRQCASRVQRGPAGSSSPGSPSVPTPWPDRGRAASSVGGSTCSSCPAD